MIDLTNSHIHEYPKSVGTLTLRAGDSGQLLGTVGYVRETLDPMEKVSVSGVQANGTYITDYQFDVPLSICLKGPLPIMQYLTKTYGLKP